MTEVETTDRAETASPAAAAAGPARVWPHVFLLLPMAFYGATCAPTIGLGDTAMLIDCIQTLTISTHVNSHNITVLIGWLFSFLPLDNIAFKANLVSVVVGSVSVAGFYYLVRGIFGSWMVAALTASVFMVSHSMWWHSTLTEVYAVNALFTVLAVRLLWRLREDEAPKRLYALFAVAALSLFNHVQMGTLSLAATVVLVSRMWRLLRSGQGGEAVRLLAMCTAVYVLGLMPFGITYVVDVWKSGMAGAADAVSGGHFKSRMFQGTLGANLEEVGFLLFQQFPSPFAIAVLVGIVVLPWRWGNRAATWGLVTIFGVNTGFFMFYDTWDRFAFLLPSFLILALAGAYGVDGLWRMATRPRLRPVAVGLLAVGFVASLGLPVWMYGRMSDWGQTSTFWAKRYANAYTYNTHNASEYIANPNKRGYYDVEEFAQRVFDRLPQNAVLVDDDSRTYYSLDYYQKYYGARKDLQVVLINSWGYANWGASNEGFAGLLTEGWKTGRPIFLVSVAWPFKDFLDKCRDPDGKRYRFHRYRLDDHRWIYQLMPRGRRPAALDEYERLPHAERLIAGMAFENEDLAAEQYEFGLDMPVDVALGFLKADFPFAMRFEFFPPGAAKPYFVTRSQRYARGSTSGWARMERWDARVPGVWTVRAMSGPHELLSRTFVLDSK